MHTANFRLDDRTIVLTGASGMLGQVFAHALAQAGASLALVDVNKADSLADEIRRNYDVACSAFQLDLSQPTQIEALPDRVASTLGNCDVVLNNAATKGSDLKDFFATDSSFTSELWREVMAVNLEAMFLISRAFKPQLVASDDGNIINISSIYGLVAPDQRIYSGSEYLGLEISSPAVYSASKAGVIGLTRHLAAHWGLEGIRANCLVPGGISSGQNGVFEKQYSSRVPLGRMAESSDMVGAIVFLASPAASYINGQTLAVDGGLTAW